MSTGSSRARRSSTAGPFCEADDVTTAYLNGSFTPLEDARISPLDRGFLYGDAVYEVVHAYRGRPFRLARHADRLARSLRELRIDADPAVLATVVPQLIERDGLRGESLICLQVTRGAAPKRSHS